MLDAAAMLLSHPWPAAEPADRPSPLLVALLTPRYLLPTMRKRPDNHEEFLQDVLPRCREADPQALRRFLELWHKDIYDYPHLAHGADHDACAEFFLYVAEPRRLSAKLRSFRPDRGASFRTWFRKVLNTLYLDWLDTRRNTLPTVSLETLNINSDDDAISWQELLPDPATASASDPLRHLVRQALGRLPTAERVLLKLDSLWYRPTDDFDPDECAWLRARIGTDLDSLYAGLLDLRARLLRRAEQERRSEESLAAAHRDLLKQIRTLRDLGQRLRTADGQATPEAIQDLEARRHEVEARIERRRLRLERTARRASRGGSFVGLTVAEIASFLRLPESTVKSRLRQAREHLGRIINTLRRARTKP